VPIVPTVCDMFHGNPVDFGKLAAAGMWGVIHKARQGIYISDSSYAARMEQAKVAGLLWAAYDFGVSDDIASDVATFLAFANLSDNDGVWLDFERNAASQMTGDQAFEFMDRVAQKLGRACGIYGGDQIRGQIKPDDPKWIDMAQVSSLWQCRYIGLNAADNEELFNLIKPIPPWTKNTLIQYTDGANGPQPHSVNGLDPNHDDLNAFLGTRAELAQIWPGMQVVFPTV
jgi:lysozyme